MTIAFLGFQKKLRKWKLAKKQATNIPKLTNLQIALAVSLSAHGLVFAHFSPLLRMQHQQNPSAINDYHLPVSVELVRSVESGDEPVKASAVPKAEQPAPSFIQKAVASLNDWNTGPIKPPTKQSAQKEKKSVKNPLISFTKAPASSAKTWNKAPVYPESARRLGKEGRVILDAQLDNAGRVVSVKVSRSSGSADLDQAAMEAVSEWTMDLPKDGSKRLFIPITFRFNSNS